MNLPQQTTGNCKLKKLKFMTFGIFFEFFVFFCGQLIPGSSFRGQALSFRNPQFDCFRSRLRDRHRR